MTAEQISEKLRELCDDEVSLLANEEWSEMMPDDFEPSPAVAEAEKASDEASALARKAKEEGKSDAEVNALWDVYRALPSYYELRNQEFFETTGIGSINQVDSHGGENEGSDWWVVYHFPKHNVYLKVSGWYQSHHGTDFEDWDSAVKEVKPKEKVITVYE